MPSLVRCRPTHFRKNSLLLSQVFVASGVCLSVSCVAAGVPELLIAGRTLLGIHSGQCSWRAACQSCSLLDERCSAFTQVSDERTRAVRHPPSGRQTPALGPQQLIISKTWFSQNSVEFVLHKTIYVIAWSICSNRLRCTVFVRRDNTYLITFKLTSMLSHVDKFFQLYFDLYLQPMLMRSRLYLLEFVFDCRNQ